MPVSEIAILSSEFQTSVFKGLFFFPFSSLVLNVWNFQKWSVLVLRIFGGTVICLIDVEIVKYLFI